VLASLITAMILPFPGALVEDDKRLTFDTILHNI
jgi:hypothetical protein